MFFIKNKHLGFAFVGALSGIAFLAIATFGIPTGIDFTGGNLAEVKYTGIRPDQPRVMTKLVDAGITDASVRPVGIDGYIVRMPSLSAEKQGALQNVLSFEESPATIVRMTDVGPSIGTELYRKSLVAIVLVVLSILIYLAWAFRAPKLEKKGKETEAPKVDDVSSWWYGLIAILTLAHDILIPVGLVSVLGYTMGAQVDTLFITALLTILGYSVNDTIVIFDRVRENVRANIAAKTKESYTHLVGKALSETYGRSINTSLTTILALIALYVFGPASTQLFALTLIVGVLAGTYSSILLAAPLLTVVHSRKK
jgi:preprotein translocase subunit SecF